MVESAGGATRKALIITLVVCGALVLMCAGCPVVMALLMPFTNRAIVAARTAGTQNIITSLSAGNESFKADWGIYPPSDAQHGGARKYGFECLAYYLTGPEGRGWGRAAGAGGPFGGEAHGYYGPYYRQDSGYSAPDRILDAFRPPKAILYFRFEPSGDPEYDVQDNPVDPACINGFASQEQFEMLVRPKDSQGNRKWVREDYLLISAGPDRLFGYVVEDAATGQVRPARPEEVESGKAECDDIANFPHPGPRNKGWPLPCFLNM